MALLDVVLLAAHLLRIAQNTGCFEDSENWSASGIQLATSNETPNCTLCSECLGCRCVGSSVDCTRKNYTHVPRMSSEVQTLIFDFNKLTSLNRSSFYGLTHLKRLHLKNNNISNIQLGTFDNIGSLRELRLYGNVISKLDDFLFSLTHLVILDLSKTTVQFNTKAFINVTSLRTLYFTNNKLNNFPTFVHNSTAVFPNLHYLSLASNSISDLNPNLMKGLRSVTDFDVSNNAIGELDQNHFRALHSLQNLIVSGNRLTRVSEYAFCHQTLTTLYLSYTNIDLDEHFRRAFKPTCIRNLESLHLDGLYVDPDQMQFQNLSKLTVLILKSSSVHFLRSNMFKGTDALDTLDVSDLTFSLKKSYSVLSDISKSLKRLYIANSKLTEVTQESLPMTLWNRLSTIDLNSNPWVCDCRLVWFLRWLRRTNVTVLEYKNPQKYMCYSPSELYLMPLKNLTGAFEFPCFVPPSDFWLVAVIISTVVIMLTTTLVSLLHRFRWHVRYWRFVYETKSRQYQELLDQREYKYDAFVIYSQADSQWVMHQLRPQLEENRPKLRLCIHHRDWLGGRDITDNIVDSIEGSRKSLLIVSNAFAASSWCQFEMTMAQTRLFEEDRDNLILVLLEEIAEVNMTPRLRLQMARQTYVEWPPGGSEVGEQLFWAQLRQALARPSSSLVNSPVSQQLFAAHVGNDVD